MSDQNKDVPQIQKQIQLKPSWTEKSKQIHQKILVSNNQNNLQQIYVNNSGENLNNGLKNNNNNQSNAKESEQFNSNQSQQFPQNQQNVNSIQNQDELYQERNKILGDCKEKSRLPYYKVIKQLMYSSGDLINNNDEAVTMMHSQIELIIEQILNKQTILQLIKLTKKKKKNQYDLDSDYDKVIEKLVSKEKINEKQQKNQNQNQSQSNINSSEVRDTDFIQQEIDDLNQQVQEEQAEKVQDFPRFSLKIKKMFQNYLVHLFPDVYQYYTKFKGLYKIFKDDANVKNKKKAKKNKNKLNFSDDENDQENSDQQQNSDDESSNYSNKLFGSSSDEEEEEEDYEEDEEEEQEEEDEDEEEEEEDSQQQIFRNQSEKLNQKKNEKQDEELIFKKKGKIDIENVLKDENNEQNEEKGKQEQSGQQNIFEGQNLQQENQQNQINNNGINNNNKGFGTIKEQPILNFEQHLQETSKFNSKRSALMEKWEWDCFMKCRSITFIKNNQGSMNKKQQFINFLNFQNLGYNYEKILNNFCEFISYSLCKIITVIIENIIRARNQGELDIIYEPIKVEEIKDEGNKIIFKLQKYVDKFLYQQQKLVLAAYKLFCTEFQEMGYEQTLVKEGRKKNYKKLNNKEKVQYLKDCWKSLKQKKIWIDRVLSEQQIEKLIKRRQQLKLMENKLNQNQQNQQQQLPQNVNQKYDLNIEQELNNKKCDYYNYLLIKTYENNWERLNNYPQIFKQFMFNQKNDRSLTLAKKENLEFTIKKPQNEDINLNNSNKNIQDSGTNKFNSSGQKKGTIFEKRKKVKLDSIFDSSLL
ncbi:hypothetical protein PPERSA_10892 [Pseudocohnilembus persalinus]|uniref:Uncharacterized protein n=1 Tax=Pseudocohnilembus persalinus TaxID=266149 RepID=A0A0V0RA16_PSEPJ|nr:hypothetical protein PPERSA_10892 [Pseudocohnilembus persalinus]|eukprot:KRX11125.1 hypothetical protein PPERSA_10892 [Pseudocohnilembus persalinus]